jgi:class 3 adenylate cyclase
MPGPTRDLLLNLLERAASGDLSRLRSASEGALARALEEEGLIELRGGAYRATAAGLTALEARGMAPWPSGPVAVLFTDVAGSTQLVERLGDADAHRVLQRHFELLRAAIADHSGREVKNLGDGLMVVFEAASNAIACAAEMQAAVAREGDRLGLRIGIHAGEPVREHNDYFGTAVIIARRLCDSADAGQTLVSEPVRQLAAEQQYECVGNLALKGLSEPVRACALAGWRRRGPNPMPVVAVAG